MQAASGNGHRAPARWQGLALRLGYALACVLAAIVLAGCATNTKEPDPTVGWTAERLYKEAKDEMDTGNWTQAAKLLEKLEARYPFGVYAQQAQIDIAYVYWKDGSNPQALAAIDRFERLHPNHPSLDYMLYLKGLINFYQESALLASLTKQDPSERDPKGARESFDAFKALVARFPDSKYAPDARLRLNYLVNSIAMNEVHVARMYLERGAYVAAVNRAQTAVRDFQGAPAVEEALYIMVLAYDKMGMTDLRDDASRVLNLNYPNSRFVSGGFAQDKGPWWKIW
ncbi:outer membrane protein assembly factor BamD [Pigmentiphaga sp. NML080357]|uniref:outer membrane protein assembly factor BamD n=1 Tax=Pigmentiphaga sp. NML080357 TaxID=2008675 RepID=UPI000B415BA9|nr:outer membrane protein assembly factor BamD [Pigmentiphaga sp. NML080357]OVZ60845.1 outer membrane protein assembly factor BamD [Pigmentiphaga sp. NML080357]